MAFLDSKNFKLDFIIEDCDFDAEKNGNPYNSVVAIKVESDGFCGFTKMTINAKDLRVFIENLKVMFSTLKGNASLKDFDYGSMLKIECDKLGDFLFEGTIISGTFQEFKFKNLLDQSYLGDFVKNLSKEFYNLK